MPVGAGKWPRVWFWRLADGFLGSYGYRARLRLRSYAQARLRNAGYALLRYLSPQFEAYWPSVWATFRYLQIRHYRGRRYRLGLPARGQRTHSNAATTRRIRNAITEHLRERYWARKLWEPRKRKLPTLRSKYKSQSRRSVKADRHRRGVVRTKKKFDV